jgi:oligopeptide transport system substrate-binding protein
MRGLAWVGVAAGLVLSGATACTKGRSLQTGDSKKGASFTFRVSAEPETLDWNRAHTPIETHLLMNLMEGLVGFDAKLSVVPALAERWTRSADGKVYRFYLRKNARWSDGVPLRAQDFVASWKRLLSPETAASYAYLLFDLEGAQEFYEKKATDFARVGVKAIGEHELEVRLKTPIAHWIQIPTFWVTFPIREELIAKYGPSWTLPENMVTVGPFRLKEAVPDSRIVLGPNPHYYGERPRLDEAVGLIVREDSTALNLFEAGRLDFMTDLSLLDVQRWSQKPEYRAFPYLKTVYLGWVSTKGSPLEAPSVRRAFSQAIDRKKLVQVLGAGQTEATSFLPPQLFAYDSKAGLSYDPRAARAEWQRVSKGLSAQTLANLELLTLNGEKQFLVGEFIQSELKKNLEIDLKVSPLDNKAFRAQLNQKKTPVFLSSWGADYPDPDNFYSVFLADAGSNRVGLASPAYDRAVLAGRRALTEKERLTAYREASRILLEEEAAILPLYYEPNSALIRRGVQGVELNPLNILDLRRVTVPAVQTR